MTIPNEILVAIGSAIVGGVVSVFKAFRFVHEGEKGVRLRFGRVVRRKDNVPRIIEPGFAFLIPFVETLKCHHVRQQSYRFPEQRIMLKDGLIFKISGMIVFKVTNVYSALFEIHDLDNSVDDICMAALRDEIQNLDHLELNNLTSISEKLIKRVSERGAQWGIEFSQFSLTDCAPTPETANLLNAGLGIKIRLSELIKSLEEVGLKLTDIGPNFAAALIGIPVVSSIQETNHAGNQLAQSKLEKESPPHIHLALNQKGVKE